MSTSKLLFSPEPFLDYKPAKYHPGKDACVIYYAYDPAREKLIRVKKRVNSIPKAHRKGYAKKMCGQINARLTSGWNPFVEQQTETQSVSMSIDELIKYFLDTKIREQMRFDSVRSYRSRLRIFSRWLKKNRLSDLPVEAFTHRHAGAFMHDYFTSGKNGVAPKTFNNQLAIMRTLFHWAVEYALCTENYFSKIRKKRVFKKSKILIPWEDLPRVFDYCEKHDKPMKIICGLVYYCLIRPKEISYLKPCDIDHRRGLIHVTGEVTKNHEASSVTIPDEFLDELCDYASKIKPGEYLFSSCLRPGAKHVGIRTMEHKWKLIRVALDLDHQCKLYSLKDNGIVKMLNSGIGPQVVMQHARHSSLEFTTIYARHLESEGIAKLRGFSGGLTL